MSNNKKITEMPRATKMKRRDAIKLTAAVAAFGSVLGFTGLSASPSAQRLKRDRYFLKLWIEGQPNCLHSFQMPNSIVDVVEKGEKILLKWYRNDDQVHNPPFSWG